MELSEIRKNIDGIDKELALLLCRRMDMSAEVAAYKRVHGTAVRDDGREEQILARIGELAGERYSAYLKVIYAEILKQSRTLQCDLLNKE